MDMTKLAVSFPPLPLPKRRERLTARALSLLWSIFCCAVGFAAIMLTWSAFMR
jgi:hypothetical protein